MKRSFLLLLGLTAFGIFSSCSDSTPATGNYPLMLTLDSANVYGAGLRGLAFRVTESGQPIKGATLYETEDNVSLTSYKITMSDSNGKFGTFGVNLDTVTELSFQAIKDSTMNGVKDTLKSNTVRYP